MQRVVKRNAALKQTVIHADEGVSLDIKLTSAATNDSFILKPTNLNRDDIMASDRAYIDYQKLEGITQRGVIYVTKKDLKYSVLEDSVYQNPNGIMKIHIQHVVFTNNLEDGEEFPTKILLWIEFQCN